MFCRVARLFVDSEGVYIYSVGVRRRDDCDYGSWERALFVVNAVMSISDSVNGGVGSRCKRLIFSGKRMRRQH